MFLGRLLGFFTLCRDQFQRLCQGGVDNEIGNDLDQKVETDESGDEEDKEIFSFGVEGGEQVGEKEVRPDNKDEGIDDGDGNCRNEKGDQPVFLCDEFKKQSAQKAGKRGFEKTNENGGQGAERNKGQGRRSKDGDNTVDKPQNKPHPRAVHTGADNDGK